MSKASRRERRSPDLHPGKKQPSGRQISSGIDQREWFSRGYLPHRDRTALTQHVTIHLADSLPASALDKIELSIKTLPETKRKIERRKKLEAWIDAGHGSCLLIKPDIASMIQETLLYFHRLRYYLYAWVVMPNHFHALFQPINGWTTAKIVASWKKFSARRIREYLKREQRLIEDYRSKDKDGRADQEIRVPGGRLRPEPVWQPEFWDRYIRDEGHYWDTVEYIHNNPVKAGLARRPEDWPWSSAAVGDEEFG